MPPRTRTADTTTEPAGTGTEARAEEGAEARAARDEGAEGARRPGAGRGLPLPLLGNVDPKRMLWFGGLTALAAVEIIEWPVALVVAAGTLVAERFAVEDMRKQVLGGQEGRAGTGNGDGAGDRQRAEAGARG